MTEPIASSGPLRIEFPPTLPVSARRDAVEVGARQQLDQQVRLTPGLRKPEQLVVAGLVEILEPLPGGRDSLDRAGYLMGIHKGLHLLFPEDEELRYGWVHLRNALLDGDSPLQVMLRDGLVGLARVARFVAFQRGQ